MTAGDRSRIFLRQQDGLLALATELQRWVPLNHNQAQIKAIVAPSSQHHQPARFRSEQKRG